MAKRNWKRMSPTSLRNAMKLNIEYAQAKHNRSVEQIAEMMGENSEYTLYKWMANGRMPAVKIRPFEHACGATYVTQYIGTSAHKLVIDMPSGKPADANDLIALQTGFNDALNLLAAFYQGSGTAEQTIAALTSTMRDIATHRANVNQSLTPELGLFEEDEHG